MPRDLRRRWGGGNHQPLFSEQKDGVREEELVFFSSKIGCLSPRLSWVETEVYTIGPSAWGGFMLPLLACWRRQRVSKEIRDGTRTSKGRGRREKLGGHEVFPKPPGRSNEKQRRANGDQIAQGLAPGSPRLSPILLHCSQLSPRQDTHGKRPPSPPGSSAAEKAAVQTGGWSWSWPLRPQGLQGVSLSVPQKSVHAGVRWPETG